MGLFGLRVPADHDRPSDHVSVGHSVEHLARVSEVPRFHKARNQGVCGNCVSVGHFVEQLACLGEVAPFEEGVHEMVGAIGAWIEARFDHLGVCVLEEGEVAMAFWEYCRC